ncbi:MAG: hypothetical protein V3V08_21810 [Nannocystaceae bacterium]
MIPPEHAQQAMQAMQAMQWCGRLIAVAIVFQTIELLQLRRLTRNDGIWAWDAIKCDYEGFPRPVSTMLAWVLHWRVYAHLLRLRLLFALVALWSPHPWLWWLLFCFCLLASMRWRGTFNGGSDRMTLVVLASTCLASSFPDRPLVVLGSVLHIAVQAMLSYFVAGVGKFGSANWRTGRALPRFLRADGYDPPRAARHLLRGRSRAWIASWCIIFFECGSPLALAGPRCCLLFIGFAGLFHLVIFCVFGLNRFVFAWAATYPALYFASTFSL